MWLGITIDTFVSLRKKLEARIEDTEQKCFICGIEKNTFNRTLDRNAFKQHIKFDQNLWNYIYFIIYVWEQDKDDDDGLETYVRRCIVNNDLTWFPLNKAIRLTQHQEKGDVTSLKFRFRKDMEKTESMLQNRMLEVKDQIGRTISRVEKALEYEQENETRRGRTQAKSIRQTAAERKIPTSNPETDRAEIQTQLSAGSNSITPRVRSPVLPGLKSTTALDADILGQMHIRMVSISGLKIPPTFIKYVQVKIISDYEISIIDPLQNVQLVTSLSKPGTPNHVPDSNQSPSPLVAPAMQVSYRSKSVEKVSASIRNTRSSFVLNRPKTGEKSSKTASSASNDEPSAPFLAELEVIIPSAPTITYNDEKKKIQLRFDLLNNPPTLVHQGPLPKSDLSKIKIKIQIMFNLKLFYQDNFKINTLEGDFNSSDYLFMGGATIPMTTLLTKAHEGKLLDIPFIQNCVELTFPDLSVFPMEKESFTQTHGITLELEDEHESQHQVPNGRRPSIHYQRRRSSGRGLVLLLPSSDSCIMTVSSVASHKLLLDWAFVKNCK